MTKQQQQENNIARLLYAALLYHGAFDGPCDFNHMEFIAKELIWHDLGEMTLEFIIDNLYVCIDYGLLSVSWKQGKVTATVSIELNDDNLPILRWWMK